MFGLGGRSGVYARSHAASYSIFNEEDDVVWDMSLNW